MKLLTVISTLFIPLTASKSLYGMNFRYMPELEWRGGYAAFWLVLLVVSGLQLLYFRKKGWL
ncbi:MAG: CorA family divalent cation transporter [Ardenticatenaceae bacterium]